MNIDELTKKVNDLIGDESSPEKIKLAGEITSDIKVVDEEIKKRDERIVELSKAYKEAVMNTGFKLNDKNKQEIEPNDNGPQKTFDEIYQETKAKIQGESK